MFKPVKIGIIGSGNISYTYLNTLVKKSFNIVQVVGCSDLFEEKSRARAEQFGIKSMTTEQILADPEIEIVLVLTQLWHHTDLVKQALEAGKHVYSEKALGHSYAGAKANYDLARQKGLRLGCAPDCYMGAAWQTIRKLIDDGLIGTPLMANALCFRGYGAHERSGDIPVPGHGDHGVTITYDMTGYYINALVSVLGAVNRVSGYTRFFEDRVFTNPLHPRYGQPVDKLTGATMIMGCLEFANGCYASLSVIAEGFGAEVDWEADVRTVVVQLEGKVLRMPIGRRLAGMDVPSRIINDRAMVPLRFVSEYFEANVLWNDEARTIYIYR
jgi:predicted dehydrogenase